jgi:hypothetical protein
MHARNVAFLLALILITTPMAGLPILADEVVFSDISGDPDSPSRHLRVENPATLSPEDAEAIYEALLPGMVAGYRLNEAAAASDYIDWPRYNTAPYRSATHGQRFVNNYANATAQAYGLFEEAGVLPVGSILAKDSFTVTSDGIVQPGPLFLMEKMPAGFNYVTGDWRYIMIMPDGSLFGATLGENDARVDYCIGCHLAASVRGYDHIFFVPEDFRRTDR